jgi:hypothetical protein
MTDQGGGTAQGNSPSGGGGGGGGTSTISFQINTEYASAIRFPVWMALFTFSVVCLCALQSSKSLLSPDNASEAWVVAVVVMSLILSLASVFAYLLLRVVFVAQIPEVIIVSANSRIWFVRVLHDGSSLASEPLVRERLLSRVSRIYCFYRLGLLLFGMLLVSSLCFFFIVSIYNKKIESYTISDIAVAGILVGGTTYHYEPREEHCSGKIQ